MALLFKFYFKIIVLIFLFIFVLNILMLLFGIIEGGSVRELLYTGVITGLYVSGGTAVFMVWFFALNDFLSSRMDWRALTVKRTFLLDADMATAYDRCIESLSELNRPVAAMDANRDTGEISVRTAVTWKSLGEYIRFKLTVVDGPLVEVRVVSRFVLITLIDDFGLNAKNIEAVARTLIRYERS